MAFKRPQRRAKTEALDKIKNSNNAGGRTYPLAHFVNDDWAWRFVSSRGSSGLNFIDKEGNPREGSTNVLPPISTTSEKIEVLAPGSDGTLQPLLELRKSTITDAGNGLFAARVLEYNQIITYFLGDVNVNKERFNNYTMEGFNSRTPYKNICYRFAHFCNSKKEDFAKLLTAPSTVSNVYVLNDYYDEFPNGNVHWGVTTLRRIEKGEELFLSYGDGYFGKTQPGDEGHERHGEFDVKPVVNPEPKALQPPPSVKRARPSTGGQVCYRWPLRYKNPPVESSNK